MVFDVIHNLPATYPNYLTAQEPQRRHYPHRFLILSCLVLLCLLPRALLSLQMCSICPDGVLYVQLAEDLDEGHFKQAFQEYNLNVYPMVLAGLHRLGLSWETGGMLWGLLMSCLVILPLYGFVRRQFDDTVALVSCLLYAVHPVFIKWSPELMRDPTFWLLFILSLYLQWRAVTEVRIGFSLAAGLATTLAVLTRFEGLFLFIPFCLWPFWRYKALISGREKAKIAAGWVFSVVVFPALLLLINITWLRNQSQWVFFYISPLWRFYSWWNDVIASAPADTAGVMVQSPSGVSFWRMIAICVPTMVKSFTPLFALPMLGGWWRWRNVWRRRDHQPLFYVTLAIILATCIHAWYANELCPRYYLSIVLMASPYAALGLMALSGRILRFVERLQVKAILGYIAVFSPAAIVAFAGWGFAFAENFEHRVADVELGAWVRNEFGPSATLLGSEGITSVVAYYARVSCNTLTKNMDDAMVSEKVEGLKPDVIFLIATHRNNLRNPRPLIDRIKELGYTEMERDDLPRGTQTVLIVLRRGQDKSRVSTAPSNKTTMQK